MLKQKDLNLMLLKTSRAVRSINDSREKTTLGDLQALSALERQNG